MSRKYFLCAFALFMLLSGCYHKTEKSFDQIAWIIGEWRANEAETTIYLSWRREANTLYIGRGSTLIEGDTIFSDTMTIAEKGGKVYLTTSPTGKDRVAFQLLSASEQEIIFENPLHDFPQKISYRYQHPNALCMQITGTVMEKKLEQEVCMVKIKQ